MEDHNCGCKTPIEVIVGGRGAKGEKGDKGKDGFLFNPDAVDVTFHQDPLGSLSTVNAALLHLLYAPPLINSFTVSAPGFDVGNLEKGDVIPPNTLTLSYNITQKNKPITTKSINPNVGNLTDLVGTRVDASGASFDRVYTLTVSDGDSRGLKTASAGINFKDRLFWGVSANGYLTPSEILTLTTGLFTSKPQALNFNASGIAGGAYMYVVVPAISGYVVNKFEYGATTVTFTASSVTLNIKGLTISYLIYKSPEKVNGANIQIRVS